MNTYVLTLSQKFPATHPRKGEPTNFKYQVLNAVWRARYVSVNFPQFGEKLHTIRANFPLWEKRFEQIEAGNAVISVRYWTGKPYASKQKEICKLTKVDGIGLQKLEFEECCGAYEPKAIVRGTWVVYNMLAKNDGLSLVDWYTWFKDYDKTKPLAIIHFTPFRY